MREISIVLSQFVDFLKVVLRNEYTPLGNKTSTEDQKIVEKRKFYSNGSVGS